MKMNPKKLIKKVQSMRKAKKMIYSVINDSLVDLCIYSYKKGAEDILLKKYNIEQHRILMQDKLSSHISKLQK